MWTQSQIRTYAEDVIAFSREHVKPVLDYLATNQTAVGIEKSLPHGAMIVESLGGASKALAVALQDTPAVGALFTAYELYQALHGRPMDQAGFDKLDQFRGSQE
jgi:hypothetical protein